MTVKLEDVKEHLHIFHSVEDDYLTRLLTQSQQAITQQTGVDTGELYDELVVNRVRYAYEGELDKFVSRFQTDLLTLAVSNLKDVGDDDGQEQA